MSKNTGKPYEKLTQKIFSQIVNQNSVQNINILLIRQTMLRDFCVMRIIAAVFPTKNSPENLMISKTENLFRSISLMQSRLYMG